uniref:Immunoglobulin superfamily member 10 n=1 Tax=Apteryx owenii TaxID=8824 RepID=A0A8B9Q4Z8_APTOW
MLLPLASLEPDASKSTHDRRFEVFTNGTLSIVEVSIQDSGQYLCVAANRHGSARLLVTFITMKPAKIDQKQYFKKLVPYGKDFKVDCKASGSPAPEISWSLPDGTTINNVMQADDSGRRSRRYVLFDNGTLYLNKVGITEEGDYTCYAQNTLGRDEMKIHITVITTAPQIKHSYKTYVKVKAGDTALLDCEVVGEPKPKIFWLLPSSDMISFSTDRYLLHVNGSLSVSQVKLLDAGEYMCVARNPGGDDTKLYKLDVVSKPPIINGLYTNKTIMKVTAVRHSKKQIECRAEGTPPPQIMWIMPDNIFLTFLTGSNGALTIYDTARDDAGKYRCAARNKVGYIEKLIILEVGQKPRILIHPKGPVKGISGESLSLHCLSEGSPKPNTAWTVPSGYVLDRPQINRKYVLLENGNYVCKAHNSAGDSSVSVPVLIVAYPPRITNRFINVTLWLLI